MLSIIFFALYYWECEKEKKKKELILKNPQGRVLIIETLNSSGVMSIYILRSATSYNYNDFYIWNAFILIFFFFLLMFLNGDTKKKILRFVALLVEFWALNHR